MLQVEPKIITQDTTQFQLQNLSGYYVIGRILRPSDNQKMTFNPKFFQIPPKSQLDIQILQDIDTTYSSEASLMPSSNIRIIYANVIQEVDKQHIQRQIEKQKAMSKIRMIYLEIKNDSSMYNQNISNLNLGTDVMISNKQVASSINSNKSNVSEDIQKSQSLKKYQKSNQGNVSDNNQINIKQIDDQYFSSVLGDDDNQQIDNLSFSNHSIPDQLATESIQSKTKTENSMQEQVKQNIKKDIITPILLQEEQTVSQKECVNTSKNENSKQSTYNSQLSKTNSTYTKNKKTIAQLQREEQEKMQANMLKLQLIEQIQNSQKDIERTIQSYDKTINKIIEEIQKQRNITEEKQQMFRQKVLDYLAVIIGLSSLGLIKQIYKIYKIMQDK